VRVNFIAGHGWERRQARWLAPHAPAQAFPAPVPLHAVVHAGDPYWWGEARLPAPGRAGNARWYTSHPPQAHGGAGRRSRGGVVTCEAPARPGSAQLFPGSDRAVDRSAWCKPDAGVSEGQRSSLSRSRWRATAARRRMCRSVMVMPISIPSEACAAGGGRGSLKHPETADHKG
jgi:hypothetical protein